MLDGLVNGHPVKCLLAEEEWYEPLFGRGMRFYQSDFFPVLQLAWADRQDRYGWEEGASKSCRLTQPIISLSRDNQISPFWAAAAQSDGRALSSD